jgi:small subunit ribosomal protein S1
MEQQEAQNGQGAGTEETPQVEQNNSNNLPSMESLLQQEEFSVELPQQGEIRTGVIASISPSQILVSIGAKSEGVIAGRELEQIEPEDREAFKVGQEIPAYVLNPEDSNGNVVLSYTRAQEQMSWDAVEKMLEEDETIETTISGYNKGGLIVPVLGLRGFVPASQIGAMRRSIAVGDTPEQRFGKMVSEPISVRIIEVDRERRRLILSERAASSESRQSIKERVIEELEEGEVRTGRVTSLADFGAFVNISGADGLVHLSELSWEHISHPSEILEVGQEVQVKIISIDTEKKRIGLSIRQLSEDPWRSRLEKYQVGQLVEGVITRLTKFGAFARLEGEIEGLIHISEISEDRIEHPREMLHEGDVVTLRVIRIDPDQRRIGLSLRKVDSAAFADKDMKILTKELEEISEEEIETPASEEAPPADEKTQKPATAEETAPAEEKAQEPAPVEEIAPAEEEAQEPATAEEIAPAEEEPKKPAPAKKSTRAKKGSSTTATAEEKPQKPAPAKKSTRAKKEKQAEPAAETSTEDGAKAASSEEESSPPSEEKPEG